MADTPAEAKPGYTRRDDNASRRDESEGLSRRVKIQPGGAAFGTSDSFFRIHFDLPHLREIDHQSAITNTMAGGIMSASAHGDFEIMTLGETEGDRDIIRVHTTGNHGRMAIDKSVE